MELGAPWPVRAAEIAAIMLVFLLVCPPLLILLVVVAVPLLALAGVVATVASVLAIPVGESLFRRRMTSSANVKRLAVAAALVLLVPVGDEISALALSAIVAALLALLAVWELLPARAPRSARTASA